MNDLIIYPALFIVCTLYAVLLDRLERKEAKPGALLKLNPDGVILEVIGGVILCMIAAGIRARYGNVSTWQDYESGMYWSFFVGGLPIGIWQVGRMYTRLVDTTRAVLENK